MPDIWYTVLDGYATTLKQNVTFQGKIHPEKLKHNRIQNGRLSAIIHLNMPYIT